MAWVDEIPPGVTGRVLRLTSGQWLVLDSGKIITIAGQTWTDETTPSSSWTDETLPS